MSVTYAKLDAVPSWGTLDKVILLGVKNLLVPTTLFIDPYISEVENILVLHLSFPSIKKKSENATTIMYIGV
jgi:hypothetical protein